MKQRYHYNVANTRVEQHVDKGNDDGLYISSVACCQDLWALIMDAGTGFTAQARARARLAALGGAAVPAPAAARASRPRHTHTAHTPRRGRRARGRRPVAAARALRQTLRSADDGCLTRRLVDLAHHVVVRRGRARGARARAQVYELSSQFLPKEWIMEKWEEGFYITAMAGSTSSSSLVVMSKGTAYTQQSYKARPRPLRLRYRLNTLSKCCCAPGAPLRCARARRPGRGRLVRHAAAPGAATARPDEPPLPLGRQRSDAPRTGGHITQRALLGLGYATLPRRPRAGQVSDSFPTKWNNRKWKEGFCERIGAPDPAEAAARRAGVRLVPLQVDQQEVEGGLLRDGHGDEPHALGGRDVAQRGLHRPVRGAGLPVPVRGHPPPLGRRCGSAAARPRGAHSSFSMYFRVPSVCVNRSAVRCARTLGRALARSHMQGKTKPSVQAGHARGGLDFLLCWPASCCSALSGLLERHGRVVLKSAGPGKSDCPTGRGPCGAVLGQTLTSARAREAGFRITACAATPDQAAFVLSVPRRRPMDETQETLRTSAFPSTHVKDKCAALPARGPCLNLSGQVGRWPPSCLT